MGQSKMLCFASVSRASAAKTAAGRSDLKRASVTVYFSLILILMVSLIMWSITSVKVSAGRMQAANSVDQAMFSLFARFDRQLMKEYDLYFLDAGQNGNDADIGACVSMLEDAMEYILHPNKGFSLFGSKNLLNLRREGTVVTDLTMATDAGGIPFEAEAVRAMKDAPVTSIINTLFERENTRQMVENSGTGLLDQAGSQDYGAVEQESAQVIEEREEAIENGEPVDEYYIPENFINPIPVLFDLYFTAVMDLVVPDPYSISERWVDPNSLVSHRNLSAGIGVIDATGSASWFDQISYVAWMMAHFGNYLHPDQQCALAYQQEYLLEGRDSDRDNLKHIINKLMLLRQAVNILCLYTDSIKVGELSSLSGIISCLLFVPWLEPAIQGTLSFLWAYAESIVDVRALLQGKKVALVKTSMTWQTDPEDIARAGLWMGNLELDAPDGMNYEQYLASMLLLVNRKDLTPRAMDLVESHIRKTGRPDFRLDSCIYALGVDVTIRSEGRVTFPVHKELSYGDL